MKHLLLPVLLAIGTSRLSAAPPEYHTVTNTDMTVWITAQNDGVLTCTYPSITLYATTTGTSAVYSWIGPNGFTTAQQNPVINTAGVYTVTATDGSNTASVSFIVTEDKAAPVTLWLADFTNADGTTAVDTGLYRWSSSHTGASTSRFSVLGNQFRVNNSKPGKEGTWLSAPVDITGKNNVTISVDVRSAVDANGGMDNDTTEHGDYIRAYYKIDDGAAILFSEKKGTINSNSAAFTTVVSGALTGSSLQVIIRSRASATDEYYYFDNVKIIALQSINVQATALGTLTCNNPQVALTATTNVSGASFTWYGPNGFTSNQLNTTATTAGLYTLQVTEPVNGCSIAATIAVNENVTHPTASATSNNAITCSRTTTDLKATSTTTGALFNWAGPNNFNAASANATTGVPGNYTLTVTDPANGCQGTLSITVVQNTTPPVASAANNGPISCGTPEVTLTGISATNGLTYFWTGPFGFSSSAQTVGKITNAGIYTLTVTDHRSDGNGCSAQYTTEVKEDFSDCFARVVPSNK